MTLTEHPYNQKFWLCQCFRYDTGEASVPSSLTPMDVFFVTVSATNGGHLCRPLT